MTCAQALRALAYIGSLRPLLSVGNLELDFIAFLKALVTLGCDGAVVDKNIGTVRAPDEPVAFCIIEPLHRAFHFRLTPSFRTPDSGGLQTWLAM
jgi:hypothetical protein